MKVVLELQDQPTNVRRVTVRHDIVIGRGADCNLRLSAPQISRRHCFLRVGRDGASVTDLDSSNGTYVDGKRIKSGIRVELVTGSLLTLGAVRFLVHVREDAAEETSKKTSTKEKPKKESSRKFSDASTIVSNASALIGESVDSFARPMDLSVEQAGAVAEPHEVTEDFGKADQLHSADFMDEPLAESAPSANLNAFADAQIVPSTTADAPDDLSFFGGNEDSGDDANAPVINQHVADDEIHEVVEAFDIVEDVEEVFEESPAAFSDWAEDTVEVVDEVEEVVEIFDDPELMDVVEAEAIVEAVPVAELDVVEELATEAPAAFNPWAEDAVEVVDDVEDIVEVFDDPELLEVVEAEAIVEAVPVAELDVVEDVATEAPAAFSDWAEDAVEVVDEVEDVVEVFDDPELMEVAEAEAIVEAVPVAALDIVEDVATEAPAMFSDWAEDTVEVVDEVEDVVEVFDDPELMEVVEAEAIVEAVPVAELDVVEDVATEAPAMFSDWAEDTVEVVDEVEDIVEVFDDPELMEVVEAEAIVEAVPVAELDIVEELATEAPAMFNPWAEDAVEVVDEVEDIVEVFDDPEQMAEVEIEQVLEAESLTVVEDVPEAAEVETSVPMNASAESTSDAGDDWFDAFVDEIEAAAEVQEVAADATVVNDPADADIPEMNAEASEAEIVDAEEVEEVASDDDDNTLGWFNSADDDDDADPELQKFLKGF